MNEAFAAATVRGVAFLDRWEIIVAKRKPAA
jgi:hypothetical protein